MPPLKRKRTVKNADIVTADSKSVKSSSSARRSSRKKSEVSYEEVDKDVINSDDRTVVSPSRKSGKKHKSIGEVEKEEISDLSDPPSLLPKKKAKAKANAQRVAQSPKNKRGKHIDTSDVMATSRVANSLKLIGAHVSAAGGVDKAIENARWIGGNSFALFLKSQRKWASPPLSEETVQMFKQNCSTELYDPLRCILPHGSYLVNLATSDPDLQTKSYDCFIDDLHRCDRLGIKLYNFHPGATRKEITIEEGCRNIAKAVNRAHEETKDVVVLLENMAGSGSVIGSKFEELGLIISNVTNKSRIGICIDTCHMFAAGYDIRSKQAYEASMAELEKVGIQYLKALHLNDSLEELGSKRDRHANIGHGHIGLEAFRLIMNDPRLDGLPMVLETPRDEEGKEGDDVWKKEIDALYRLIGRKETDDLADIQDLLKDTMIKTKDTHSQEAKRSAKAKEKANGAASPKPKSKKAKANGVKVKAAEIEVV